MEGTMQRQRAKLVKFDPYARSAKKTASADLSSNWSFFESADSIMIDDDISGRVAHNPIHRCEFFYLGRPTHLGKPTVLKFSFFQGMKIAAFIGKLLDQYAEMRQSQIANGRDEIALIPFLRGKEARSYSSKDENRVDFWAQPDLDLGNIKVSAMLNATIGLPEVLINSPVPLETTNKLKGWPGPVMIFSLTACANLEAFILENRKENIDFHIPVRPKLPGAKNDGGEAVVERSSGELSQE